MSDTPQDEDSPSNKTLAQETSPHHERFFSAFDRLFKFYDYPCDLKELLLDSPMKEDEEDIDFAIRFLNNRGFAVKKQKARKIDVAKIQYPILIQSQGEVFDLYIPREANDQKTDDGDDRPQKLSGYYIEVQPESSDLFYADHMDKGHALDWFWEPLIHYKSKYWEVFLATIFINCFVLVVPLYSLNIYDRVITNFVHETLFMLTAGAVIALTFDFVFKNLRSFILEKVVERVGNDYDFKLMERFMNLDRNKIKLSIGEQANIFRELQGIREFYAARLIPTVVDVPFVLFFLFIIYLIAPILSFTAACIIVVLIVLNLLAHYPIGKLTRDNFTASQNKTGFLIETLSGIHEIKNNNAKSHRLFHWDLNTSKNSRMLRNNNQAMTFVNHLTVLVSQLCHICIIFVGVFEIEAGTLTIGGLIACTILSSRAIAPAINMANILSRLEQTQDVLRAVDRLFKLPHDSLDDKPLAPKGPFKGEIRLSKANYTYPDQKRPALDNVDIHIKPGDKVGIIGKTAAGKSTIAKIINGLLPLDDGHVFLDNYDYRAIPVSELRRTIAYAPQDAYFFRGSVYYNITLGKADISEELLHQAIQVSGLHIVLQESGEGLDMEVGEQGSRLSGGQKQAITLARAIIRNPKVLLFDEPTNGMDSFLENHVQTELANYIKDKTFVMITHRPSLLNLTNRLILVDKGRVVADGPTQDILAKLSKGST